MWTFSGRASYGKLLAGALCGKGMVPPGAPGQPRTVTLEGVAYHAA